MKDAVDIVALMADMGARAKAAAAELSYAPAAARAAALEAAADAVAAGEAEIIAANALDLDYGRAKGLSAARMDRPQSY